MSLSQAEIGRRRQSCFRKKRYATEADAKAVARRQMARGCGTQLRNYACEICGGFHLTSQPLRPAITKEKPNGKSHDHA